MKKEKIADVCESNDHPGEMPELLPMEVLHTPAGYYLGTFCQYCGPYDRKTTYIQDKAEAEKALEEYNKTGEIPGLYWRL